MAFPDTKKPKTGKDKDDKAGKLTPQQQAVYDKAYAKALKTFSGDKEKAKKVARNAVSTLKKKHEESFSITTKIQKTIPEEQMVFGWSYVSVNKEAAEVVDHSGESMDIVEVEKAAYDFNLLEKRSTGEMHLTGGMGDLVESMVFTKEKYEALGVDPEGRPQGWWVGFKVQDEALWKGIKEGKYSMFSIEGTAKREALPDDAA